MKNEKLSRLFLRFNGGGPVGYTQAMPGQLPEYQTGADLSGVDMKTLQDFEHYYGGKYPILAEGGDIDAEDEDQSFYTNRINTFIKGIQETAQKNLLKEVMRESQGENEEREYTDEEMIQAGYGMNVNQRPDYGSSLYDAGNLEMFAKNKIGDVKNAFKDFGQRTALIDKETAYNKKNGIPDTYTDIKSKFRTGMADIFKQKNPVYDNYSYGEMGYGGGLNKYVGDENSSTTTIGNGPDMLLNGDPTKSKEAKDAYAKATANNTGTGVVKDDNQNGFRTQMINGKLYAIGPDGRMFEAAEAKKEEEGTRFDYRNRNRLTPEFAEAMRKGTYLDSKLLGPPIIEEKGWGPFKRNITTWQYGKLSGDPYAPNNNVAPTPRTTVPGTGATTKSEPDPNDPRIVSPGVRTAEDYTFRPGQGGFAPSGGWQDYPGTMEINQAGPRNTDEPEAGPFQSQYIPGSADYPNVPGVPDANNVGPKPTVSGTPSTVLPQTQSNVNPSVTNPNANTSTNPNDWRNYKPAGLNYTKDDVNSYWNNIKAGKDFQTPSKNVTADEAKEKQKIIDQTSKLPTALQMQVRDAVFNTSMDPRLDLMYAAGVQGADGMFLGHKKTGVDAKGNPIQVSDPSLRVALRDNKAEIDKLWNDPKTQALVTQQYNDDPEAFTSSFGDQRKVSYSRLERNNGDINKRYPGWAARVDNVTNNWDTFDNVPSNQINDSYNALILDNERRYGTTELKKNGGTMIPMFGPGGPFSFTDMAEEEEDGIIYDPSTGSPLELPSSSPMTDQQRIDVLDKGTEFDKSDDPNTFFTENEFNVKQKSKTKKKPSFNKMMRNMSAATAFFNQDERIANKRKLSEASQASNVFNTAPSFYGNDIVNSGKRMIGDGSGIPVFNTGYAQMGGSMLDNMKEGDEVYLTEAQINDILKRGGKLSYL